MQKLVFVAALLVASCQTTAPDHRPAIDQAERLVLQKAGDDLSCQGRISVSEVGNNPHQILAEGCGRQASYQMDCAEEPGCKAVHRL